MSIMRSDEELASLREGTVKYLNDHDRGVDGSKLVFGCDGCAHRHGCMFAYDPYNIDGDCLASK